MDFLQTPHPLADLLRLIGDLRRRRSDLQHLDRGFPRDVSISLTVLLTCVAPAAAALTSPEICRAAPACCSTADAISAEKRSSSRMVAEIPSIAATDRLVVDCIAAILELISWVAPAVCAASALTSCATTAKPRPASPARAASIVALSASRLVCPAIAVISSVTLPISCATAAISSIVALVRSAS